MPVHACTGYVGLDGSCAVNQPTVRAMAVCGERGGCGDRAVCPCMFRGGCCSYAAATVVHATVLFTESTK